jgi:hypothetical protein
LEREAKGLTAKLQNLGRQFLGMSCDFGNDANLVGWIGFRFQVSHNRILPVDMEEELVVIRADLAVQNSGDRLVDVAVILPSQSSSWRMM